MEAQLKRNKNILFLLITFSIILFSCLGDTPKNENNNGWISEFHKNGKISSRVFYFEGEKEGIEQFWNNDGILLKENIYEKGFRISHREFRSNGSIKREEVMKGDSLKIVRAWNEFNPSFYGEYMNGKECGEWVEWYRNGNIKKQGNYFIDENFVPTTEKDNDNSGTIFSGRFVKSPKNNSWKYYYHTGKLQKEETWDKGVLKETKEYDEQGNLKKPPAPSRVTNE